MKHLATIALVALTAMTAAAKDVTGKSYKFTIPDEVTFESHANMEFYTFKWGTGPLTALFMLSANPAPITPRAIKPMVDMMEVTFEDQMKKQGLAADLQKKRSEIALGRFKGTELEFVMRQASGITVRQYVLVLYDGERAWNGQLTGWSTNDIATAHAILEKAEPIVGDSNDGGKK